MAATSSRRSWPTWARLGWSVMPFRGYSALMLRFTSAIYPVGIPKAMKIFSQTRTGAYSVKGQMFGHMLPHFTAGRSVFAGHALMLSCEHLRPLRRPDKRRYAEPGGNASPPPRTASPARGRTWQCHERQPRQTRAQGFQQVHQPLHKKRYEQQQGR